MGLLPIPAPKLTQGVSRAGFWRAAALYDKRLPPPSFRLPVKGGGGLLEQSIPSCARFLSTTCRTVFNLPSLLAKPVGVGAKDNL